MAQHEDWATPSEADSVRGVLGAFADAAGDPGQLDARLEVVRAGARHRVRVRRTAKAAATGGTACVLVGAIVAGVAQGAPWRSDPVVPAGSPSAVSTPDRPGPTPTGTSRATPTQSPSATSNAVPVGAADQARVAAVVDHHAWAIDDERFVDAYTDFAPTMRSKVGAEQAWATQIAGVTWTGWEVGAATSSDDGFRATVETARTGDSSVGGTCHVWTKDYTFVASGSTLKIASVTDVGQPVACGASAPEAPKAPRQAWDTVTAHTENGYVSPYWADDAADGAFTCGAPVSGMLDLRSDKYVSTVSGTFGPGSGEAAGGLVTDVDVTRLAADNGAVTWGRPAVVLTQGGRIVDFGQWGWNQATVDGDKGIVRGKAVTQSTGAWETSSFCTPTGVSMIGRPTASTPRHAAGTYLAYFVSWYSDAGSSGHDWAVSDAFPVTVGQDGKVTSPVAGH
ncbi:hypothetical protein [Luteimicrobium subarcticum]|uniref:Uncharacterized protein n=1 Tax=Luteimicrobium subarcticum TaxID=620910 RepID=A0A2M8WTI2_9MICO|nr:hypothetical protein [Luteimicrobium subarcticum]PJI94156.1 hypothetical protein CLV34_1643 [Luteimicrobium subarcticum]